LQGRDDDAFDEALKDVWRDGVTVFGRPSERSWWTPFRRWGWRRRWL